MPFVMNVISNLMPKVLTYEPFYALRQLIAFAPDLGELAERSRGAQIKRISSGVRRCCDLHVTKNEARVGGYSSARRSKYWPYALLAIGLPSFSN
jgi:hypothetical protein